MLSMTSAGVVSKDDFSSRARELKETFARIAATRSQSMTLREAAARLRHQAKSLQTATAQLSDHVRRMRVQPGV